MKVMKIVGMAVILTGVACLLEAKSNYQKEYMHHRGQDQASYERWFKGYLAKVPEENREREIEAAIALHEKAIRWHKEEEDKQRHEGYLRFLRGLQAQGAQTGEKQGSGKRTRKPAKKSKKGRQSLNQS